jgi:hypothetical protein
VRREPRQFGIQRSRWTLGRLRQVCNWLAIGSDAGMHKLLRRLGISYKRGREYVHSPDPDYVAKVAALRTVEALADTHPDAYVLVYLDEVSIYRQPTVANNYETTGHRQPLARRVCHHADTMSRVIGAVNRRTGQVLVHQRSHITVDCVIRFLHAVHQAYPTAKTIFVVLDNWPVHFHPQVLAHLEPQQSAFPLLRPASWHATTSRHAPQPQLLPIQLIPLPSYASWLNPIEKLWRKLKQDEIHLHTCAADWQRLKERVIAFFNQFADGSPQLRRYIGLNT